MNKIISILGMWLCTLATFAQLNTTDDWDLPDNPGLVTKTITVAANTSVMGTAEVTTATIFGTGIYPVGSSLSLTATANTGYKFVNWTVGDNVVSTNASFTYVMPDNNVTVTANFSPKQYVVKFLDYDGKEISSSTLDYGATIVTPDNPEREGYSFSGWDKVVAATVPANDVTYTAQYAKNSYNVVYTVDGTNFYSTTALYGAAVPTPVTNPTKTGYTFDGWNPEVATTMPASDVTYEATWKANTYTVTFDPKNGEEPTVYKLDYGTEIKAPNDPTYTGHTFTGWTPDVAATVPAENVTYSANWTVNSYTVTFDVDGVTSKVSVEYGATIQTPANPEKEGYTFKGWSPEIPSSMPAADATYTAQFEVNQYLVTFVADNKTIYSKKQNYGSDITAPTAPTVSGFNFVGWSPAVDATVPAHDVTYTAQYGTGEFNVSFIVDGVVYSSTTMNYGEQIVVPSTNPTKTGYTFAGWENYVEGSTVPANDVSYNATWTINSYKVTFDVDGATTVYTLDYGTAITAPADPEKTGYTFTGWTPTVAETVPANDVTYTATWKVNKYNVTFVNEGNVYSTSIAEYGTKISLPEANPTKEGYTFAGWENYTEDMSVPANDVTFNATWTVNKYTVEFISDGVSVSSATLDYGTTITVPAAPEKTGYTFTGWTPTVAETVPASNVTYTASFKVNQYNVTFVVDGATVKSEKLDYGTEITAPTDPVKDGFVFAGWDPQVETVPANDITFTATWNDGKFSKISVADGEGYTVSAGQVVNTENFTISVSTESDPMTSVINDGTINADNVVLNLTIPNNEWKFVKFPCDVPVSELKNSEAGTTWQIRKYDAAARANVDLDNVWVTMTNDDVISAEEGVIIQSRRDDADVKTSTFTFTTSDADAIAKILNGQDATISVKANESTYASNSGWNLVGNPYMSYFDIDYASLDGSPITVWENNTFRAYTPGLDSYKLEPLQAFFVQTSQDASIVCSKEGRVGNADIYVSGIAPRKAPSFSNAYIYDISITDGENTDYTRLIISDDYSMAYEIGLDASKFMSLSSNVPQIYSTDGDTDYAINVRPVDNYKVNLSTYFNKSGRFTISVENASTDFALIDRETNELIVLGFEETNYTFNADYGTVKDRFYLNFDVYDAYGIDDAKAEKSAKEIYTIQGVKVSEATRPGIYIVNGKKYVVK
ncbi:MAG: InlB B-repeat-containing protein [Bacteroidaceae bacterium]|nr:InlB B-repeat-containing protein [Bacteroidaceae bacterium]